MRVRLSPVNLLPNCYLAGVFRVLRFRKLLFYMVRPERFELPTNRFEADYSIQLSYGRMEGRHYR